VDREQKKSLVQALNAELLRSSIVIVVHYKGLSVADVSKLRDALYRQGVAMKVTKNTLSLLSVKGTPYESSIKGFLSGPTALVHANDPVAAAKTLSEYSKENEKLVILGGAMAGERLSEAQIHALAKLPSLDELRGKLLGLISAPARNIACVVNAVLAQVPRVIKAYGESKTAGS
jgi:large subunit ribosomal protein L10